MTQTKHADITEQTFDEVVDENLAYMIQELCKGTKWHEIVFVIMDRTLTWYRGRIDIT